VKAIAYILSVYLVLLTAIPCCAFDQCPDDKQMTEQHTAGDEDDCGSCSPFFNCEGCATPMTYVQPVFANADIVVIKRVYTDFIQPSIPDAHYDFWQPPRQAGALVPQRFIF
jgi:hypothetical protein